MAGGIGNCFFIGSVEVFPADGRFFLGNSGFLPSGLGGTGFLPCRAGLAPTDGLAPVGMAGFFGSGVGGGLTWSNSFFLMGDGNFGSISSAAGGRGGGFLSLGAVDYSGRC